MRVRLGWWLVGLSLLAMPARAFEVTGFHGLAFGIPFAKAAAALEAGCTPKALRDDMKLFVCDHWLGQPTLLLPLPRAGKFAGVVVALPEQADPIPGYERMRAKLQHELHDEGHEQFVTHTNDNDTDLCPERAWQLRRVRQGQGMLVTRWVDAQGNHVMLRTEFHPPRRWWVNVLFLASAKTLGLETPQPVIKISL
jgi:hypothetical protein